MTPGSSTLATASIGGDAYQSVILSTGETSLVMTISSSGVIAAHERQGLSHLRQERASHRARGVPVSRPKEGS